MQGKTVPSVLVALVSIAALVDWALPAAAAPSNAQATVINVTAGKPPEFRFTLSATSAKTGAVTFKVTNKGTLSHDFEVCASSAGGSANACTGKVTPLTAPGKTATLAIIFTKSRSYEYLCTVPGHAASGMKGDLKVS